jgi:tetratricopeptide (TPR) repeat protein
LQPNHTAALTSLASIALAQRDHEAARSYATLALVHEPDQWEALLIRGAACVTQGDFTRALSDLNHADELNPNVPEVRAWRGFARFELREYAEAVADLRQACDGGFEARQQLSIAQFRLGDNASAFATIDLLLAEPNPTADALATAAYFLACCAEDTRRDGRRALDLAMRAQQLQGEADWYTHTALAAARAELGQFSQAVEHAERSLALAPALRQDDCRSRLAAYRNWKPYRYQPPMT